MNGDVLFSNPRADCYKVTETISKLETVVIKAVTFAFQIATSCRPLNEWLLTAVRHLFRRLLESAAAAQ